MEFMKMRSKALERAKSLGFKSADLARAMSVPTPRLSEWANLELSDVRKSGKRLKTWKPTAWQVLALSRFLKVTMESLVDDEMELVPTDADEDDRFVVRTYRTLGLSAGDAVRLLNSGVIVESGGVRFRGVQLGPDTIDPDNGSGRSTERRSG